MKTKGSTKWSKVGKRNGKGQRVRDRGVRWQRIQVYRK